MFDINSILHVLYFIKITHYFSKIFYYASWWCMSVLTVLCVDTWDGCWCFTVIMMRCYCSHVMSGEPFINTLGPGQDGRHFPDDIFTCSFVNENVWISITISLKFVPKGPNNNIPALVHIMAWRRPGDKSLSEPMMASLLTHICVTRPQWVKELLSRTLISLRFHGPDHKRILYISQQHCCNGMSKILLRSSC